MASFGQFSHDTLVASTRALASTATSNSLASQMRDVLSNAAFKNQAATEQQMKSLIDKAESLLAQSAVLAAG